MNGIGEMFGHISLGIISFSGGLIIAFGLVALIMGLNLIPRNLPGHPARKEQSPRYGRQSRVRRVPG